MRATLIQDKYIEAREALIPLAVASANGLFGKCFEENKNFTSKKGWRGAWSRAFHAEMSRLAYKAGLVKFK